MQTEDQKTEARCTDWIRYPHLGMAAYRIWQITNGVLWLQAHEWQLADGSSHMSEWSPGADGFVLNAQLVAEIS